MYSNDFDLIPGKKWIGINDINEIIWRLFPYHITSNDPVKCFYVLHHD